MKLRLIIGAAVLLFWSRSSFAQTGPPIPITPVVETASVRAGTTTRLALLVHIPDKLHIQADKVPDPFSIPARLTIDAPTGVSLVDVAFPPSQSFRIAGFDEPQAVFEGEVVVGARLKIAASVPPGPLTVAGHFRVQSCIETNCYAPHTIDTSWTLTVVNTGGAVAKEHADVFNRIDFTRAYAPAAPAQAAPTPTPQPAVAAGAPTDVIALFDSFTILNRGNPGGYKPADEFVQFIHDAEHGTAARGPFADQGPLAIIAIVFVGGLALNLTPCVLPMIPINLAIIGAGARQSKRGRGFWLGATYGAAMALVYGVLGVVVVLTAGTFGSINASPWFNFGIAALFVVLGLAMFDVLFSIDLSRYSSGIRFSQSGRGTFVLAFAMGAVAALLAGACVAPVVIQVVVFASNLYARGISMALALPFVLGLGMALPWPIAGAGFAALPKPGMWMVRVKHAMGVFILVTAAYYGYVGYEILANRSVDPDRVKTAVEEQLKSGWQASLTDGLNEARRRHAPVLVDFWASWCKDCFVMDKTTLQDPAVREALKNYVLIKVQSEDMSATPTKELLQRIGAHGLPAYAILRPPPQ